MKIKIAVPIENGKLCAHFGHCEKFAILEADETIISEEYITPPVHEPGVYPRFLAEKGVNIIIAGGMGQKAQDLFAQNNIRVLMGVENVAPKELVDRYLKNQLQTGQNLCDH